MCDDSAIVKQRQLAIRREMDRRGIALKVLAQDSRVPYSTLASYFPADRQADPAQIPGGVIYALCSALPGDLLSLLLPDGFQIVRAPEDVDHDDLAAGMHDYLQAKTAAHHPDSPAGPAISDCEREGLDARVAHLPVRGKVA